MEKEKEKEKSSEPARPWIFTTSNFPLDYSVLGVSQKWAKDIPPDYHKYNFDRNSIGFILKNSSVFRSAFQACKEKDPPIMIELEAFFRDFFLAYFDLDKASRKNIRNSECPIFPDDFGVAFFKNVHTSIYGNPERKIAGKPEELAYYEKMLYKHPAFQKFAAEYYWEAEFDKRCSLLKKAVFKCSPELRLRELPNILRFLDSQIGAHVELAKKSPYSKNESMQDFLSEMSDELCKLREEEYEYFFGDFHIENPRENQFTLSYGFSQFADNPDDSEFEKKPQEEQAESIEAARKPYLISLSEEVEKCDAYIQARELDAYLLESNINTSFGKINEVIKEIDLSVIRKEIQAIALYHYIPHFYSCHFPLFYSQKTFPINATTSFLDGIIVSMANAFPRNNQEEMQTLLFIDECKLATEKESDDVKRVHELQMESPELFLRLFHKYIGQEFPFNNKGMEETHTFIEFLVAFYYYILSDIEFPDAKDLHSSDSILNTLLSSQFHPTYNVLLFYVLNEWNTMVQEGHKQLHKYLDGTDATFPCSNTYLHSVLFFIKLYYDYQSSMNIAEECYIQYKERKYLRTGKIVWKHKEKAE